MLDRDTAPRKRPSPSLSGKTSSDLPVTHWFQGTDCKQWADLLGTCHLWKRQFSHGRMWAGSAICRRTSQVLPWEPTWNLIRRFGKCFSFSKWWFYIIFRFHGSFRGVYLVGGIFPPFFKKICSSKWESSPNIGSKKHFWNCHLESRFLVYFASYTVFSNTHRQKEIVSSSWWSWLKSPWVPSLSTHRNHETEANIPFWGR